MSIDVMSLKGKGTPPPLEEAPRNTEKPPREKQEPLKPLQFFVPESVYEEFSIEAIKECMGKGGKTAMFLKLWERHKRKSQ